MNYNAKMESMNASAETFNEMSEIEQNKFIQDLYVNVKRYTHSVFKKLGRPLYTSLQRDVFDNIVQEVVFSLIKTLKENKFDSNKAKFSTVLATYVKYRVYREGYLEKMEKRKGVSVPILLDSEDGTVTEWLASEENIEESFMETVEQMEKKKFVDSMIAKLTPREQTIVRLRMEEKTLEQIGQVVGVTRERVRQILDKVFRQMRNTNKLNVG